MFTKEESLEIIGGFSRTRKMPGLSWSIPAKLCKTGSKLREVKGSTCAKCYAMKGRYTMPNVQEAMFRRFQAAIGHKDWTLAMTWAIYHCVSLRQPYFRWFDSGDLHNWEMLENIVRVATDTQWCFHWLPTREIHLLKEAVRTRRTFTIPNNLVIRRSHTMIDAPVVIDPRREWPAELVYTSGVKSKKHKDEWPDLVQKNNRFQFHCPAPLQDHKCGECRACWDPAIRHIDYLEH